MNRTPEKFIDINAAAALEHCHVETLRRRVRRKLVPAHYPNGVGRKPMLFLASELQENRDRTLQDSRR